MSDLWRWVEQICGEAIDNPDGVRRVLFPRPDHWSGETWAFALKNATGCPLTIERDE